MPIVPSLFSAPMRAFRSPHLQTILPALTPVLRRPAYRREQIDTADGDLLELDWSEVGSNSLCIISHGLEGSSASKYIQRTVPMLNRRGLDVLVWNFRGCGGVCNRFPFSYHSGLTADLASVVQHALAQSRHEQMYLLGFSVGGNITLKYLAEYSDSLPAALRRAAAISVPVDLASSAERLADPENGLYMRHFLVSLRERVRQRARLHPRAVPLAGLDQIRTFREYDGRYIAPFWGFDSAEEYWAKASSLPLLDRITLPTLLLSARDDSFLGTQSFPYDIAERSGALFLETPHWGGHVGFWYPMLRGYYGRRILEFFGV